MDLIIYSVDELRNIIVPIAAQYAVDKVYLFGSYARGTATAESDVDLYIDAEKLHGIFALGGLYADLEQALKKKLDLVTEKSLKYNTDRSFLENLKRERVLLYEAA
ncbi:MAG: nucleotidyltransferase domain-containing protein [Clostridia bacterium]|nr:nucleotidyltransferase domain-containing protein [Clostridia bacterium]